MTDAEPELDLILAGGHVLDPGQGLDGRHDIGIADGRIVALAPELSQSASQVIDVSGPGRYVVPGLIDLHTHVAHGATTPGVGMPCCEPDVIGVQSGVTTLVDCGSVGVANLGVFPTHILPRTQTRVIVFANAACHAHTMPGMADMRSVDDLDAEAMRRCVEHNPGLVQGIKLRLVGEVAAEHGEELVARAVDMAAEHGVPFMTHIGDFVRDDPEHRVRMAALTVSLLDRMRPGDILTHLCTPRPGSVLDGEVFAAAVAARERGIILDPALGKGNFGYAVAAELAQRGLHPDTISSDLTGYGETFHSLVECMAKFMAIGYSLADVVRMTTVNPARALGLADRIGALAPGREADISVLETTAGSFSFTDTLGTEFHGDIGIAPVLTLRAGAQQSPRWGTHPWGWLPAAHA